MSAELRKVRVVIPTTGHLAEIVLLAHEAPDVGQSIVCIGGTANQAGISREYDSFVRRPTGIIEKLFGHATFRMDVGLAVDVGSSWQLATLIAHALQARGRLHQSLQEPDQSETMLVWATGAVRSVDLAVGEVGHVAEKAAHALSLFREARMRGVECLMLLPEGNLEDIPPSVRSELDTLGVDIVTPRNGEEAMRLVDAAPSLQKAADIEPAKHPKREGNPYPGLRAFTRAEGDVFYGRGRAREETVERLRRNAAAGRAFLLIHGRSGVGKSSLAVAGIANDVVNRAHEGGDWRVAIVDLVSMRGDPLAAVAGSIAEALAISGNDRDRFLLAFEQDCVAAVETAFAGAVGGPRQTSLLLILDQLEQAFFTSSADNAIADFGHAVGQLSRSGCIWIVATMRTDQLELLEVSPDLSRLATDDRSYKLIAPTLFELTEIITQPAIAAGLFFEMTGLSDQLAEIALLSPDALPILQFILSRMVELAGPDQILSQEIYDRLGGFEGAIVKCAEDAVEQLEKQGVPKTDITRALADLVRIDQDGKQVLAREALRSSGIAGEETRIEILDYLTDARLLVSIPRDGTAYVRLAHEALIRNWPRLQQLINEAGAALHLRDKLDVAAAEWTDNAEDASLLLRGDGRISAAEGLVEDGMLPLHDQTMAYINASRQAYNEEKAQRQQLQQERLETALEREKSAKRIFGRTVMGASAALAFALLSVSAGAWAYAQHQLARQSESLGLARLALDRAEVEPVSALVLALAAASIDPGAEAPSRVVVNHAIAAVLAQPRTTVVIPDVASHVFAVSPDGETLLTATGEASAQMWDLERGTLLNTFDHGSRVVDVAFGEAGTEIVTVSGDGVVKRWYSEENSAHQDQFTIPDLHTFVHAIGRIDDQAAFDADVQSTPSFDAHAEITLEPVPEIGEVIEIAVEQSIGAHLDFFLADAGSRVFVFMDNYAEAWNVETGALISSSEGFFPLSQYGVKISPNGRFVVDGTGLTWDVDRGRTFEISLQDDDTINHLAFYGDTLNILRRHPVVETIGVIERINLLQPEEREILDLGSVWPFGIAVPVQFELSPDQAFAVLFSNGHIASGNASDESGIRTYSAGTAESIWPLSDGRKVILGVQNAIRLIDMMPNGRMRPALEMEENLRGRWPLALAPNESTALVQSVAGRLSIFDLTSGSEILDLPGDAASFLDRPQYSASGNRLTLLSNGHNERVQVTVYERSQDSWHLQAQTEIVPGSVGLGTRWMLSDGGDFVLEQTPWTEGHSPSEAIIRAVRSPNEIIARYELVAEEGEYRVIGMSPDGARIALSGSFGGTRLVDVRGGEVVLMSRFSDRIHYTPDGQILFSIRDYELSVIDPETMLEFGSTIMAYDPGAMIGYRAEEAPVMYASESGRVLAVGGFDPADTGRILLMDWTPPFFGEGYLERACASLPYVYGEKRIEVPLSRIDLEGFRVSSDGLC